MHARPPALLRLLALLMAFPATAVLAQTITATPPSRGPGADFVADMGELRTGATYRVDLAVAAATLDVRYTLLEFTATGLTETRRLRVPTQAQPGDYRLELRTSVVLAQTPFRVEPPLSVGFDRRSASAGERVGITVEGTRAGTLTLTYAGEPLQGAVPVGDGSWTGSFLVPSDRPLRRPADVEVVATNWNGRNVSGRGIGTFRVAASPDAAPYTLTFDTPPPATVEPGTALTFSGQLLDPTGQPPGGRVSFFWRADDGSRMVPIDGGVLLDASGNFSLAGGRARAPGEYMDGVPRMGSGELVGVVQGNGGTGPTTGGAAHDFVVETNRQISGAIEAPLEPLRFTIRVLGEEPDGPVPVGHAYLEVQGEVSAGFTDPGDGPPPQDEGDLLLVNSQLSRYQIDELEDLGTFSYSHGCPISFAAQFTEASGERMGEADFALDPDAVKGLQVLQATKEMGEILTVDFGAPIPGIDVQGGGQIFTKEGKAQAEGDLYLNVRVVGGQRGYGFWGIGSEGDLAGIPIYEDENLTLVIDSSARTVVGAYGVHSGDVDIDGQVVTVTLPKLPPTSAGVVPFNLRIDELSPKRPTQIGQGAFEFRGMNSFPAAHGWSVQDDVDVRNVGRKMRFAWDTGFGAIQEAKLVLTTPDGIYRAPFALEGDSACNFGGIDDYVTSLPDMTAWPANPDAEPAYCRSGHVIVTAVGGRVASTPFTLCTRLPPESIRAAQVRNDASRSINALTQTYAGELDIREKKVVANDSDMTEWEVPPQTNAAASAADFFIRVGPTGQILDDLGAGTDHTIANSAAEAVDYAQGTFGFDGSATRSNIERHTILDTGLIPLFRYPWGVSPIAGAVFGADLWMAASLAFYGKLDAFAPGGNLMNATIDPTLNGGVNVFFDLDVLFGLVSASVSANPQIGLSIKEVIGRGGLSDDVPGVCFGFDMDVAMEICAVFCAEDEFNLFRVRSNEDGDHCQVSMKTLGTGPGIGSGASALPPALDLGSPRLFPSAAASGGNGFNLVVEATADGQVVAHHLDGGTPLETRVVAPSAWSVQHVDVEFLGSSTALAVWSQSTLSRAYLESKMSTAGAVRAFTPELARAQTLYWSYFDGSAWSAPAKVPAAQQGTGKPRIATNRCQQFGCLGPAPRAYVVWEHDANGNIEAPDIEIWGARFTPPASFATGNRISGSTSSSDMHPDVVWLGSRPLVVWISSPLPHYRSATARALRYRMVDFPIGGGISTRIFAPPLAAGAGWPALGKLDDSTAVLAYTVAQDDSVVGNRNALHAARASCGTESCTWNPTELRDPAGRQVRGERPVVVVDADGSVVVSLRGLAYGPDANGVSARPVDPLGMLTGSGEHLDVRVPAFDAPTTQVAVQALSNDGLQHWRPDMVFDPATDAFLVLSQVATMPVGKHVVYETARHFTRSSPPAAMQRKALGGSGLSIGVLPSVPDLRVERLELAADWLQPGQAATASVDVRNVGAAFDPAFNGAAMVHAAWDAPPGVGIKATDPLPLQALDAAAKGTVLLQVTAPADHGADRRRTLFVEVRSEQPAEEASAGDNVAQVTIGAMPVPGRLLATMKFNSPLVTLSWDPPADPRVVGYRVYRRAENGEFVPYGSTDVPGYADLFAGLSNPEEYRVTSYSINGIESAPSEITLVIPQQTSSLFRDGFETATPR